MQPKSFICRMAMKAGTFKPESRPQTNSASQSTDSSEASIASRMSVSAICSNQNPLVSLEAIASQMRLGQTYEEPSRGSPQVKPQPATAWEQPELTPLSDSSSSLSETSPHLPIGELTSPQNEEETPRPLKRKRQPPKVPTTPASSARTTPAHSPSTVATSPGFRGVARKLGYLRLDSPSPTKDENQAPIRLPRLRSENQKLKAGRDPAKASSHAEKSDLATVRAELANEKRVNTKLKAQAGKHQDDINRLRSELEALHSMFESEKLEKSTVKDELVDLRADLEVLRYQSGAGLGGDTSINPETTEGVAQIVHMNELLRRVLQGERVYRNEMYGKLQSVRKKVGPLLAKVDELQGTVEEMKVHLGAHDAPIELIMDFVRNFHQWWVDRYNARHQGHSTEPTDGPQP
ncbi:hypothetical protein F1880_008737 [Penicillium rolfsii]|nr:hypothetical protein F1880_008737 [Penicillium rolfsii]